MKKMVMVLCLVLMGSLVACGGGNNNPPPIYNDWGNCIANCNWDAVIGEDGFEKDNSQDVAGQDNPLPLDCAVAGDQNACIVPPDLGHYVCPEPDNPPEFCKPSAVRNSYCAILPHRSFCTYGSPKYDEFCTTDEECQFLPVEDYPPCACWGKIACVLGDSQQDILKPAVWVCEGYGYRTEYYWEMKQAGQYCKLVLHVVGDKPRETENNIYYYSPEWDYLLYPAPEQGPMKKKITLLENENQYLKEVIDEFDGNTYSSVCYKKEE